MQSECSYFRRAAAGTLLALVALGSGTAHAKEDGAVGLWKQDDGKGELLLKRDYRLEYFSADPPPGYRPTKGVWKPDTGGRIVLLIRAIEPSNLVFGHFEGEELVIESQPVSRFHRARQAGTP